MSSGKDSLEPDLNLEFTRRAFEQFYDVVDDPYFRDQDPDAIYNALKDRIQTVSFGDFLKRYICRKAELTGDYQEIPLTDYRDIICNSFQERQTPASFSPTTARLKNLAKNWLEQKTGSRAVVLLLGFGLGMTEEDVEDFLVKALKEQRLNAKDPFEVILTRLVTGMAIHCVRRGSEVQGSVDMLKEAGIDSCMSEGTVKRHMDLAKFNFADKFAGKKPVWQDVIAEIKADRANKEA